MTREYKQPWRCVGCTNERTSGKRHIIQSKTLGKGKPLYLCEICVDEYETKEKANATAKVMRKLLNFKIRGVSPNIGEDANVKWVFNDNCELHGEYTDSDFKESLFLKLTLYVGSHRTNDRNFMVDISKPNFKHELIELLQEKENELIIKQDKQNQVAKILHRAVSRCEKLLDCREGEVLDRYLGFDSQRKLNDDYKRAVEAEREQRKTLRSSNARS
jgi:hypothetical protein